MQIFSGFINVQLSSRIRCRLGEIFAVGLSGTTLEIGQRQPIKAPNQERAFLSSLQSFIFPCLVRFAEGVELITISWLEIHGKIRTQSLSKNTAYSAYLVMNISNRAYGLDMAPFETSVKVGNRVSYGTACVCRHDEMKQQNVDSDQTMKAKVFPGNEPIPSERNCGWTEIKLGEFFTGEEDEEVNISLMETKGYHLKAGLVIEGIEVRPKD